MAALYFLDEIGDMPLVMQAKLLRSSPGKKKLNILAALNRFPLMSGLSVQPTKNLPEEIENHRFRSDLYFRLNVIQLELPPLRERHNDIDLCAEHFLSNSTKNIIQMSGFEPNQTAISQL